MISKAKRDFGYAATVSVKQGIDMVVKVLTSGLRWRRLLSCACSGPYLSRFLAIDYVFRLLRKVNIQCIRLRRLCGCTEV